MLGFEKNRFIDIFQETQQENIAKDCCYFENTQQSFKSLEKTQRIVFMSLLKLAKFSKTPVIFRSNLLPRETTQFTYLNLGLQFGLCKRWGNRNMSLGPVSTASLASWIGKNNAPFQRAVWNSAPSTKMVNTVLYLQWLCYSFLSIAYILKSLYIPKHNFSEN